jgi:hypothetical protein
MTWSVGEIAVTFKHVADNESIYSFRISKYSIDLSYNDVKRGKQFMHCLCDVSLSVQGVPKKPKTIEITYC